LTGTLVDITCATDPKRNLTKLRSEHTRKCLLMPICAESDYALLTDRDEVLRFDAKGTNQHENSSRGIRTLSAGAYQLRAPFRVIN
jgi:hypothetical protein